MALGLVRAGACLLLGLLVCPACTQACLMCFVTDKERIRICQMFVGMKAWKTKVCDEKFQLAFEDLLKTEINYDERNNLHDSFTQMVHSLQETAVAKGFYIKAFSKAAEEMKKAILQLKKVPACVPPCGVQELTRRFICDGCYSLICKLPLNCPVKDVTVNRGDQAMFSCVVDFQLPKEDISYSWKFAKGGVRTQDMSYFRDLPRARGSVARIRPAKPVHAGTYSCVIRHDVRPVARLYFFLNVTGPPPRAETELQVTFREVVRWSRKEPEVVEPWKPGLGELLTNPWALTWEDLCLLAALVAVMVASLTVLVWMFCRWYFSGI
ncbi:sperm acrosome membrane-associated protein 6 isoform X6 [Dipodomys merriami]|uniref:sperm acrosome membrane-associated protein 6 isoform X6 n=1 Tax=Dipodomys merriami TaxID=94247 RepID=UPI0038557C9C